MEPLREIRNRLLNGWQLSKMHTFEVAARHQSFALAAEELSLSPSAVSHRINQLEEELGIQLFVRSHRKVELTHEGKRVYWALKSSLDTLNQEILDIKNQELSGTLTLYSRPSIAQCWLVPALGDFTRRYRDPLTGEPVSYYQQDIKDVIDDLANRGFIKVWDSNEPGDNWRSSKLRTSCSRL